MTNDRAIILIMLLIWGLFLFRKKWNSIKLKNLEAQGMEEWNQWKREQNLIVFNEGDQFYFCDDWENENPFKKPEVIKLTIAKIQYQFILYTFTYNGLSMSQSTDVNFAKAHFKKLTEHIVNTNKYNYK
jgi:hypothetical protein